jgi:hypothetical protein
MESVDDLAILAIPAPARARTNGASHHRMTPMSTTPEVIAF